MELFRQQQSSADTAPDDAPEPAGAPAPDQGLDYEPVAGVSIELYVAISRELAADGFEQSHASQIATAHGVAHEAWAAAVAGWNHRIRTDSTVAAHFNALYLAGT